MDINQNIAAPGGCRCWANTYALGHGGHCCFVREDRNRRIDNGFKAVEDICHAPTPAELPYGLQLGQHLTDGEGLWRVDADGLTDLAGGDDWDWQGVVANGGLGILRPIADEDGETPDSYLDGVDGHWYVCRYDRTAPQIHARDCETCAAAAPAEPSSWAVSTMNRAELAAFIGEAEAVRDYGLEVVAGRATGWTVAGAAARSDRAQLALNDLVARGVI